MIRSRTYSCDGSACSTIDDVVWGTRVSVIAALAARACCPSRDCDLVTRLKPFASDSGMSLGICRILSFPLVVYLLDFSPLSFMRRTTRCSSSIFCGAEESVVRSRLTRSTVPSSCIIAMEFIFTSSTG